MVKVLFVCLGNICRSPMAEGSFKAIVEEKGLEDKFFIDSAGTAGYHVGEPADSRMRETAFSHGITLTSRARQFVKSDLNEFDYVVAMDENNYWDIKTHEDSGTTAKILMMREYDEQGTGKGVPDPYYGGIQGFEEVYNILMRSNARFLDDIISEKGLE